MPQGTERLETYSYNSQLGLHSLIPSAKTAVAADPPVGFADLFEQAYGRLVVLAGALVGDRVEAEDLVQEAALVGLDKFSQFEQGTNFMAWMSRIVRLHASNLRSKQARRRTWATDPVDIDQGKSVDEVASTPTIAEVAAGKVTKLVDNFDQTVAEALQVLSPVPRACLLLRVVHDLSYDEIAGMLDIPAGTAMSHVHRSRTKLRKRLSTDSPEKAQETTS